MNLPGKVQNPETGNIDNGADHHSQYHHSSSHDTTLLRPFVNEVGGGNTGDLKHHESTSSTTSTSAADTLSMLTQSMLGTMPSAVATAAAAGLFMRVSGGGNGVQDNVGSGKSRFNLIIKIWRFLRNWVPKHAF